MGVIARKGLIAALRSRISDDRPSVSAFSISVTGEAKEALLELTNGFLLVTVEGAEKARSVRFGLSLPNYNTVGKLISALTREEGYTIVPDETFAANHPSVDLQTQDGGIKDIANNGSASLRHTIFADEDLMEFLSDAISFHNPNYRINNVPEAEKGYVLLKASARAYRVLASDSAKRRGLATDAKVFLQLAKDLEDQYDKDSKRRMRIIPSPKIDESQIHSGDIIQGAQFRRSLRAGYSASYRNSLPPETPTLLDPSDDDVEDTLVRLRWKADRDESFSYYEMWRDTVPEVMRHVAGRLEQRGDSTPKLPTITQFSRPSTSRQVLGLAVGANRISPTFDGFFFWTAAELAGSNIVNTTFIDGLIRPTPGATTLSNLGEPLEPETQYYYRIYTVNWNGEVGQSNVVRVRTKVTRALFARTPSKTLAANAITPLTGPIAGGTNITITGTNIVDGTKVTLGGKACAEVSRTLTEIVVTTPGMTNLDFATIAQDLVMTSPTGLRDIAVDAFTYTNP